MRLKKIKLSGFKSFVDPTTIDFPNNLVGVVGPNGCGKSNVIDAVRWVMGESSAKQLRGESLVDVIFNGSSGRKPVGQASVELLFDNQEGTLGGEYARYAEISIKRQAARDGQSIYYLNGSKCRRKDVTDIFLGTGLGPRSYAIIEQGMIARLIEAKPDELRVYLEEAAGISKYKERRKETESRIEQTLTNMARLNDIRSELEKQLQKLHTQARAAEKYQGYKQEESECIARLYAFRWQNVNHESVVLKEHIEKTQRFQNEQEAVQIALNTTIDEQKSQYQGSHQIFNRIQGEYYEIGAELSKQQQILELEQKRQKEFLLEQESASARLCHAKQNSESEEKTRIDILREMEILQPNLRSTETVLQGAAQTVKNAESEVKTWQEKWDIFNQEASQDKEHMELARSKLAWKEEELQKATQRIGQTEADIQSLDIEGITGLHAALCEDYQNLLKAQTQKQEQKNALTAALDALQEKLGTCESTLNREQTIARERKGQLASLVTLQEIALGVQKKEVAESLESANTPRVVELMEVEKGYEKAVEAALGIMLGAYCVEQITLDKQHLVEHNDSFAQIELNPTHHQTQSGSFRLPLLASKMKAPYPVCELLQHIFVAQSVDEAMAERMHLKPSESILTCEGIWFGRHWVKRLSETKEKSGVLKREKEIRALKKDIAEKTLNLETIQKQQDLLQDEKKQLELNKEKQEQAWVELQKQESELRVKVDSAESKLKELEARKTALQETLAQLRLDLDQVQNLIHQTRAALEALAQKMTLHDLTRSKLSVEKERYHQALALSYEALKAVEHKRHELDLAWHAMVSKLQYTEENIARTKKEIVETEEQMHSLDEKIKIFPEKILGHQKNLQYLLTRQQNHEKLLLAARQSVEALEQTLKELERNRQHTDQRIQEIRAELEQGRLQAQALQLKGAQHQGRIEETGKTLEAALSALLPELTDEHYQQELQKYEQRIARLGPINLMAIHEHKELLERKTTLDAQCADLEQALNTLREAIQKIDLETRMRFQATFDAINQHLKGLFQKIFEGGEASLEMTGTELLDAGVTVIARPPGKRNSSIHLLSGGEKALTAIALVFSIFQLNPAPFCMLDEVDAPLDDANVSRYCRLLNEMADKIQFIFITHNKNTMQLAAQLIGVTMQEPGVSRLVGVDIGEAMEWAQV